MGIWGHGDMGIWGDSTKKTKTPTPQHPTPSFLLL